MSFIGTAPEEFISHSGLATQRDLSMLRAELLRKISPARLSSTWHPGVVIKSITQPGQDMDGVISALDDVGMAQVQIAGETIDSTASWFARPLFSWFTRPPVVGEIVLLLFTAGTDDTAIADTETTGLTANNVYYISDINLGNSIVSNAASYPGIKNGGTDLKSYDRSALASGDQVIESRHGSAVKFLAETSGDGRIIIRNKRQANDDNGNGVEDIDNDLSSVWMSSSNTVPLTLSSTLSDSISRSNPQKLDGRQILLNSDRIVFNARKNEIMMSAAKHIHLSSLDKVGIDAKKQVAVVANKVLLGAVDGAQSAVLGSELSSVLSDLIDAVAAMTFAIASTPSVTGTANNSSAISAIKLKIKKILSNKVFIG